MKIESIEDTRKKNLLNCLGQIKYCDLTSESTKKEDAMEFCKKISRVFIDNSDIYSQLKEEFAKDISEKLKEIGCCKYNKVAKQLLNEKELYIHKAIETKNDLNFPLSFISQLIDSPYDTFVYGISKGAEGGKSSWLGKWLATQESGEDTLNY